MDDMSPDEHPAPPGPRLSPSQLLRTGRHFADLSQRELALRSGVAKSVIGDLESGRTAAPSYPLVERLLEACGLVLRAVDPQSGRFVAPKRHSDELDGGGRYFPAHLQVREVRNDSDWWFSRRIPGVRRRPQFTADWRRNQGRQRVRRSAAERRAASARRLAGRRPRS